MNNPIYDSQRLTKKCIFLQVSNLQIKLFLHFSNKSIQLLRRLKKSDKKNFSKTFDTRACFNMMLNQWKTSNWKKWFWNIQTQGSKSCSLKCFFNFIEQGRDSVRRTGPDRELYWRSVDPWSKILIPSMVNWGNLNYKKIQEWQPKKETVSLSLLNYAIQNNFSKIQKFF